MVIFVWKVANGLVSGFSMDFTSSGRRGLLCQVKETNQSAPASVKHARDACLSVRGAKLFNLIPAEIRSLEDATVTTFKSLLDEFVQTIPDQPTIPGRGRAAASNSLIHQIPMQRQQ